MSGSLSCVADEQTFRLTTHTVVVGTTGLLTELPGACRDCGRSLAVASQRVARRALAPATVGDYLDGDAWDDPGRSLRLPLEPWLLLVCCLGCTFGW